MRERERERVGLDVSSGGQSACMRASVRPCVRARVCACVRVRACVRACVCVCVYVLECRIGCFRFGDSSTTITTVALETTKIHENV